MSAMCYGCARQEVSVVIPDTYCIPQFGSACHGAIPVLVLGICHTVSSYPRAVRPGLHTGVLYGHVMKICKINFSVVFATTCMFGEFVNSTTCVLSWRLTYVGDVMCMQVCIQANHKTALLQRTVPCHCSHLALTSSQTSSTNSNVAITQSVTGAKGSERQTSGMGGVVQMAPFAHPPSYPFRQQADQPEDGAWPKDPLNNLYCKLRRFRFFFSFGSAPSYSAGPCMSLKPLPNFTFSQRSNTAEQQNSSSVAALYLHLLGIMLCSLF